MPGVGAVLAGAFLLVPGFLLTRVAIFALRKATLEIGQPSGLDAILVYVLLSIVMNGVAMVMLRGHLGASLAESTANALSAVLNRQQESAASVAKAITVLWSIAGVYFVWLIDITLASLLVVGLFWASYRIVSRSPLVRRLSGKFVERLSPKKREQDDVDNDRRENAKKHE